MGVLANVRNWMRPKPSKDAQLRAKFEHAYNRIRAKYDAAQTTDENRKHWVNADDLSARAANSWQVRSTLRKRARYEYANNCFAKGIVNTFANEIVGTCPRLQLQTPSESANRFIEREFAAWCEATEYAAKLRLLLRSRLVDGEGFWRLATDPGLGTAVSLNLRPFEPEQCTSAYQQIGRLDEVDGIRFDAHGNPMFYFVLAQHPGGENDIGFTSNYVPDTVPAHQILHFFRTERPRQARGVPDLTPALPLFAQLRRYTLAVLLAAELVAEYAIVLKTDLPPGGAAEETDAWEGVEVLRGMMQTLPMGWEASQLNPGQSSTGYGEFCDRILKEIGRCLEMPYGIAAGDSSDYNYASGRLDVQVWQRKAKIERHDLNRVNNRVFASWLDEAALIPNYLPLAGLPPFSQWRKTWFYDGFEHVDPLKEAQATAVLLANHATTLERIYAARGEDWVEMFGQRQRELAELKSRGLLVAEQPAAPVSEQPQEEANAPA